MSAPADHTCTECAAGMMRRTGHRSYPSGRTETDFICNFCGNQQTYSSFTATKPQRPVKVGRLD
jgi:hypothetical protein